MITQPGTWKHIKPNQFIEICFFFFFFVIAESNVLIARSRKDQWLALSLSLCNKR